MIDQAVIAVCGTATVLLSQDARPKYRRWACIVGVAAQPAWFYATISAEQWGMVALSVLYTLGWLRGVRNFWLRKAPA